MTGSMQSNGVIGEGFAKHAKKKKKKKVIEGTLEIK